MKPPGAGPASAWTDPLARIGKTSCEIPRADSGAFW
jgi:hypothetical protein